MTNNTMDKETNIEHIVMRRVRLIRILRLIISTVVLAAVTFVATLWGIGREVWVARVIENMPRTISGLPSFCLSSFLHTHFIVQVLTILTIASLVYLVVEIARLFSSPRA